ncbi:hypothetical protein CRG98_022798 [Punica granatum]|uniref:Uncharacterized protein n=1 Tax=Punica granatum TaxID=22663 RepID=A0A2I0JLQ9_PUNGR|nr:hypothetical protein CRG98_022798 [Punica granatum]
MAVESLATQEKVCCDASKSPPIMGISKSRELTGLQQVLDVCISRFAINSFDHDAMGRALSNLKLEGLDEILLRDAHHGSERC